MEVESAYSSGNKAIKLGHIIEKVYYGFCQRGFSEKLWVAKRTYILIFSSSIYVDSVGKKILNQIQSERSVRLSRQHWPFMILDSWRFIYNLKMIVYKLVCMQCTSLQILLYRIRYFESSCKNGPTNVRIDTELTV